MQTNFLGSNLTILWHFEKWNFHKLQNLKFFAADFSGFSLKIFLNSEKYHNLVKISFTYRWNPLEKLVRLKRLFSYSTRIRASTRENVFLTKVSITPTVHNFFCIFCLYLSNDTGFIIIHRQFVGKKSQFF